MKSVLRTKAITKVYNSGGLEIRAVDNVDIELKSGEFVALVGPSGSGKTTLLALMAALLDPTEGMIQIDGTDLSEMSEAERVRFRREKIGFTFQANNLVPYLTVQENVELMLRLNHRLDGEAREKAIGLLHHLGLGEQLRKLPAQLSGGQRQRVSIARSLIHDPSLVLADEPTASLDTERATQVVQIYADLIREGDKAGVIVTHDLRMVQYVDRVIQMVDGKVIEVLEDEPEILQLAGIPQPERAEAFPLPPAAPRNGKVQVPQPLYEAATSAR
jgi:putative ABC transport system ATP-binding protein